MRENQLTQVKYIWIPYLRRLEDSRKSNVRTWWTNCCKQAKGHYLLTGARAWYFSLVAYGILYGAAKSPGLSGNCNTGWACIFYGRIVSVKVTYVANKFNLVNCDIGSFGDGECLGWVVRHILSIHIIFTGNHFAGSQGQGKACSFERKLACLSDRVRAFAAGDKQ